MADLDPKALEALKNNQRQLDQDGVFVGVSREALDMLIAAYEGLSALVPTPPPVEAAQEPVAWPDGEGIVTIYDPRGEVFPKQGPHKIIDASMSFMHEAKVGDRLYSQAQVEEIVRASLYAAPATGWRTMESAPTHRRSYSLEWDAAPRPPVHPSTMRGRQAFDTFDDAVSFMRRQPADAKFIALTEVDTSTRDRSDDVREALQAEGE